MVLQVVFACALPMPMLILCRKRDSFWRMYLLIPRDLECPQEVATVMSSLGSPLELQLCLSVNLFQLFEGNERIDSARQMRSCGQLKLKFLCNTLPRLNKIGISRL